jgi:hypothetical protein
MNLVRMSAIIVLFLNVVGLAQSSNAADIRAIAETLEHSLRASERELVEAADAMPEERYSFAPTEGDFKGVRTFGEQVKHVATINFGVWSNIQGEKPPIDLERANSSGSLKSKAEILKFLKDSYAYAHKVIAASNDQELVEQMKSPWEGTITRLSMAIGVLVHAQNHYGQMVEYLRMNRIVPPESR